MYNTVYSGAKWHIKRKGKTPELLVLYAMYFKGNQWDEDVAKGIEKELNAERVDDKGVVTFVNRGGKVEALLLRAQSFVNSERQMGRVEYWSKEEFISHFRASKRAAFSLRTAALPRSRDGIGVAIPM